MQPADADLPIPSMNPEGVHGRPLRAGGRPGRIVVIRLHAFGDVAITLPVLAGLRRSYPDARVTVVTDGAYVGLFRALSVVDRVYGLNRSGTKLARTAATIGLAARIRGADLVLDLQRSNQSQLLCSMLRSPANVMFDRYAPHAALDRYMDAVRFAGLSDVSPVYDVPLRPEVRSGGEDLLRAAGHDPAADMRPLVCLNPAGCWPTKNWPVEEYVALGRELAARFNARVVLLGTEQVRERASIIARELGRDALYLVGRTTVVQALALVRHLRLMVSDDSGLMHLSWVAGVPTVGIFGSSRTTWSRPYGPHTYCFSSEDLPCGACMSPACSRGDRLCLVRLGHQEVLRRAEEVMGRKKREDGKRQEEKAEG